MKKLVSVALLGVFLLSACGAEKPEKERFVDATVEVACMIFDTKAAEALNEEEATEKTKDIFEKHGFDVEDEAAMQVIAGKYQQDESVKKAVEKALFECAGDLFKGLTEGASEGTGDDADADAAETETK